VTNGFVDRECDLQWRPPHCFRERGPQLSVVYTVLRVAFVVERVVCYAIKPADVSATWKQLVVAWCVVRGTIALDRADTDASATVLGSARVSNSHFSRPLRRAFSRTVRYSKILVRHL